MIYNFKQMIQSFVKETSIHGVNFIAGHNRSKFTRIFWLLSFVITTILFAIYISRIYMKWRINPNISIRYNTKFLSEIPFPAITICSPLFARDNLANFSKFYKGFSDETIFDNLSSSEMNYFKVNMQSCNPLVVDKWEQYIIDYRTETNVLKLLDESSLKTDEILIECEYRRTFGLCTKMFNRVLTDRGFCFSFNMEGFHTIFHTDVISDDFKYYKRTNLSVSPYISNPLYNETLNDENETVKWTLEKGFSLDHHSDEVPVAARRQTQLTIYPILSKSETENLCQAFGEVFNYYIHLPNEIMSPMHKTEYIKFNTIKHSTLTAKAFKASEDLRRISPHIRGCYFDGERKLKFFKSYTKSNCEYECMTNYTLSECGCVKFGMPRDKKTQVCDWDKAKCYYDAMTDWPRIDSTVKKKSLATCNCLRACSYIQYKENYDVTRNDRLHQIANILNFNKEAAYSALTFNFDQPLIEEEEDYAAYEFQNFIADSGGLLGLFMGCSLLSLIEILHLIASIFLWKFSTRFAQFKDKSINAEDQSRRVNFINVSSNESFVTQRQHQDLQDDLIKILSHIKRDGQQEIAKLKNELQDLKKQCVS